VPIAAARRRRVHSAPHGTPSRAAPRLIRRSTAPPRAGSESDAAARGAARAHLPIHMPAASTLAVRQTLFEGWEIKGDPLIPNLKPLTSGTLPTLVLVIGWKVGTPEPTGTPDEKSRFELVLAEHTSMQDLHTRDNREKKRRHYVLLPSCRKCRFRQQT
jgi:hypothetical protein